MKAPNPEKCQILDRIQDELPGKRLFIIEAPPGSGKTFLAILAAERIVVTQPLHDAQRVLIMTFSRNARAQLEREADITLSSLTRRRLEITNFHSFFQKYVFAFSLFLGLGVELELLCPDERRQRLRDLIPELQTVHLSRDLDALFSCLEFEEGCPIPHCSAKHMHLLGRVRQAILGLNRTGRLSHSDLVYHFLQLITKSPLVLDFLQRRYPYLILDEYQDVSDLQDLVVRRLLGESGRALVLADELQMIHEWRGASLRRLDDLRLEYPSHTEAVLKELSRYQSASDLGRIFIAVRPYLKTGAVVAGTVCTGASFVTKEAPLFPRHRAALENTNIPEKLRTRLLD